MAPAKSSRSPAFQFYPKDFLSSSKVQRMSLTEVGIYILLLSRVWLDGGLPTDIAEIAKLVKVPTPRFARMWKGALSECFTEKSGRLVNPRLELARKDQAAYRLKQKDNAERGWQTRGRRAAMPPHDSGNALHLQSASASATAKQESSEPLDVAFRAFQEFYPKHRRKGGRLIEEQFMFEAHKAGSSDALMAALRNHVGSEQWADPKLIPGMDTWLKEERWRQLLPAKTGSAGASLPDAAATRARYLAS